VTPESALSERQALIADLVRCVLIGYERSFWDLYEIVRGAYAGAFEPSPTQHP
jgi:hypothetical protein